MDEPNSASSQVYIKHSILSLSLCLFLSLSLFLTFFHSYFFFFLPRNCFAKSERKKKCDEEKTKWNPSDHPIQRTFDGRKKEEERRKKRERSCEREKVCEERKKSGMINHLFQHFLNPIVNPWNLYQIQKWVGEREKT